jgi:hypothetical protein
MVVQVHLPYSPHDASAPSLQPSQNLFRGPDALKINTLTLLQVAGGKSHPTTAYYASHAPLADLDASIRVNLQARRSKKERLSEIELHGWSLFLKAHSKENRETAALPFEKMRRALQLIPLRRRRARMILMMRLPQLLSCLFSMNLWSVNRLKLERRS